MAPKRVAIIGAGVSGLCAIKSSLDEGLNPICFEVKPVVGGLWNFSEEVINGHGSVAKLTVTNLSKEMMCLSDFPMPASAANYLPHNEYNAYLARYAEANNLQKHIKFETEVETAKLLDDGRWLLTVKGKDGKASKEQFDFLMVCSGMHGRPKIPDFPGLKDFQGKIMHAHEIRNSKGFEGKRIIIVGLGNTGGDVSVELSRVAAQVSAFIFFLKKKIYI